jgi:recombination endonuclease VII
MAHKNTKLRTEAQRAYESRWRTKNRESLRRYRRQWRAKNKDKSRATKLLCLYRMATDHWDQLYTSQNGLCAICDKKRKLNVDHDHTTGKVRGLLCFKCNTALGTFEDTISGVQRVIDYLEKSNV